MQPYDYVIVGAGPAGCVLANRLSEDPTLRVALIEAGPDRNAGRAIIRIPLAMVTFMAPALAFLGGPRFMSWFTTQPEPGLQGRQIPLPRGQGTGGSSNVNGQIFVRGQREDFDAWRDLGNSGWGYDDLLPYFRKLERLEVLANPAEGAKLTLDGTNLVAGIDPGLHGTEGPLNIAPPRQLNPMTKVFLRAARMAGLPLTADFNGARQNGAGLYSFTQAKGQRVTAEGAYLNPVRHRPNLTVLPDRRATRIVMEGHRATGVAWSGPGGDGVTRAREVILSAGTFMSPVLLMLSGIGDAAELSRHRIDVVHHLPGVGLNLQDHLDVTLEYKARTTAPYGISWRAFPRNIGHVLDWLLRRRGLFASTTAEAGAFVSTTGGARPDAQLFFCAGVANTQNARGVTGHGFLLHVCELRPGSIGRLRLKSADPADKPEILYNFLRDKSTTQTLREGIKLARRIAAQPPFASHLSEEVSPGPDVDSDGAIDAFVRNTVGTLFHPVGTCAMGTGEDAVVDPATLRVHGLEGLRVVDASIMPVLVSANTVAATYCLAEKAADLIR
jgi:choline dehydrogenase-like flavoprotein